QLVYLGEANPENCHTKSNVLSHQPQNRRFRFRRGGSAVKTPVWSPVPFRLSNEGRPERSPLRIVVTPLVLINVCHSRHCELNHVSFITLQRFL
ncbi:MAG: hypothetical protein LBB74_04745, partial [Chitinispirillales bacterium]|nr:hypothetical protein [Chitinispirillales bacterium]